MTEIQANLLNQVAGISTLPGGAYNIRADGNSAGRQSSANITITPKELGNGIDIHIRPGTKHETMYIPVVISKSGIVETVYNDFYVGAGAEVTIVAGCGIHSCGNSLTQHDGIHSFFIERGAKVTYIEKHYGEGEGRGERVLKPVTNLHLGPDSRMDMDTVQIEGVDSTKRITRASLEQGATLVVKEKLMTHGEQYAETLFDVDLSGEGSSADIVSRSVAKGSSRQIFLSNIRGNTRCMGHSECDAIIMDNASVKAVPEIIANHVDASLIHEAAIGKIAGEQLIKLMTLGLSEQQAEAQIVNGFLK